MSVTSGLEHDRAAQLLEGPRGRYVCGRVAQLADPTFELPYEATGGAAERLIEQLSGLDTTPITAVVDPLALMDALGASVDAARYWQAPDERDELLGDSRIASALDPVARALAVAPAARWWWSPMDPSEQSIVRWLEQRRKAADRPQLDRTSERLQQWRHDTLAAEQEAAREWPTAYDASYSGSWWSTPAHANITTTSRRLDRLPAVQLELVEDSMGWGRARVAPVVALPDRRILEIVAPSDWIGLAEAYPLHVDRSRRPDWWRATGGTGPWQIPDWAAVSRDYDAVHLTVIGYLSSAGRALPTRDGQTVLAGFDPDLAYWLTDSLSQVGPPSTWRRTQIGDLEHEWLNAPTAP